HGLDMCMTEQMLELRIIIILQIIMELLQSQKPLMKVLEAITIVLQSLQVWETVLFIRKRLRYVSE
ncbi:MAG: hypothetical protein Q8M06_07200, partial [Methanobacteriaceae archaeon]|nr:hypothetical protein [Methanobacteriaceae archaeon]